jgi:bifunctional UDP-N-acetylglucosamine pyrophosphorylase/glucosamine-1-phosphate N-acetyltransferase
MKSPLAVVVLAAGLGTRLKSRRPKVMHEIAGRPMIGHIAAAAARLRPAQLVAVIGPDMDEVAEAARRAAPPLAVTPAIQRERKGTGHAVLQARRALVGHAGDVLILLGDAPLIKPETLRKLLAARRAKNATVAVLGMRLDRPGAYGRLVAGKPGELLRIVEARDANASERAITLCNSGVMAVDGAALFGLLDQLEPDNAKGEYYVTDIVAIARRDGRAAAYAEAPADELIAVNSRAELALAEAAMQARLRQAAMDNGATLVDPASVWFAHDTRLGRDVTIGPNVVFGPGARLDDDVVVRGFCHVEGARVAAGATIGPFARLRPGAVIGAGAHVGNFVEIKAARLAKGAKVNHLSYIGDARVGERANVGAGTITCNYDGFVKSFTDIGAESFIGSNTALVAPVRVGRGAIIAAGSVITRDVPAGALAVARGRQEERQGWAASYRRKRAAAKRAKD